MNDDATRRPPKQGPAGSFVWTESILTPPDLKSIVGWHRLVSIVAKTVVPCHFVHPFEQLDSATLVLLLKRSVESFVARLEWSIFVAVGAIEDDRSTIRKELAGVGEEPFRDDFGGDVDHVGVENRICPVDGTLLVEQIESDRFQEVVGIRLGAPGFNADEGVF